MKQIVIFNSRIIEDQNVYDVSLSLPEENSHTLQFQFENDFKARDRRCVCNRLKRMGNLGLEMCLTVPLERELITGLVAFVEKFGEENKLKVSRRIIKGSTNENALTKDKFLDHIAFSSEND